MWAIKAIRIVCDYRPAPLRYVESFAGVEEVDKAADQVALDDAVLVGDH
jgi:hypothetical protein